MDGNRQGLDARRRGPSADEVKNLRASREELAVALTMERDLHRAWRGLSSHTVANEENHGLCMWNGNLVIVNICFHS